MPLPPLGCCVFDPGQEEHRFQAALWDICQKPSIGEVRGQVALLPASNANQRIWVDCVQLT